MINQLLIFCIIILTRISSFSQEAKVNAVALRNGCKIVVAPPSFTKAESHSSIIENWTNSALIDENNETGWCSPRGVKTDLTFIFELSEKHIIDSLVLINSSNKEYPGLNAKDITIAFSCESQNAGFKKIGDYTLKEHKSTSINIKPSSARWIMLQIHSNFGNQEYTELMDFQCFGNYTDNHIVAKKITGLWNSNWGHITLKENEHGLLYGCYKSSKGSLVTISNERRIYNLEWKEVDLNETGWALLVMNEEGNSMNGIWGYKDKSNMMGFCNFNYKEPNTKNCYNDKELENVIPNLNKNDIRIKIELIDNANKQLINGTICLTDESGNSQIHDIGNTNSDFVIEKGKYTYKISSPRYFTISGNLEFDKINSTGTVVNKSFGLNQLTIGNNIKLDNILFKLNSNTLLSESENELNKLLVLLNDHPKMKIELSGHTDNTASSKASLKLSQQRVDAVIEYLVNHGISKSRLKGIGYGDRFPIASNSHESTRKLNRRVEFKILKF